MSSFERSFRRPGNSNHSKKDSMTRMKQGSPDIYMDMHPQHYTHQSPKRNVNLNMRNLNIPSEGRTDLSDVSVEVDLRERSGGKVFKDDNYENRSHMTPTGVLGADMPAFNIP